MRPVRRTLTLLFLLGLVTWAFFYFTPRVGLLTEAGAVKWYGLDSLVVVRAAGGSKLLLGFENGTCRFEKAKLKHVKQWIRRNRKGRFFHELPTGGLINLLYIDEFEERRFYTRCDGKYAYSTYLVEFRICARQCNEAICGTLSRLRDRGIDGITKYTYNKLIRRLDGLDPGSGPIWRKEKTRVRKLRPPCK